MYLHLIKRESRRLWASHWSRPFVCGETQTGIIAKRPSANRYAEPDTGSRVATYSRIARIPYVWLPPQAALERLSGVPQVCERRRRPAQVAKHCRCPPWIGGLVGFLWRTG